MPRFGIRLASTLKGLAVAAVVALVLWRAPFQPERPPAAVVGGVSISERARVRLFEELQPLALNNCDLRRFGEADDGGYLLCANLLREVQTAYSYGISGYDQWGCDVSRELHLPVHRYDCFDTRTPACPGGTPVFHAACVGPEPVTRDGRVFDTLENHVARNGDAASRLVVKMDVEGAEWDSLLQTPNAVLNRIDQLVVEFHKTDEQQFVLVVQKLKTHFLIANLHFNNHSCESGLAPFPSWAYEVLFVSRRLAAPDPTARPRMPHPQEAPNDPLRDDCQVALP